MGGRGSGGRRVGSGRKSKGSVLAFTHGTRPRAGTGAPPAPPAPPQPPVEPPDSLTAPQREVWDVLAPLAVKALTLTPVTVWSFRDLCQTIVNRDELGAAIQAAGWEVAGFGGERKKHPLEPALRGWEQRVEAGLARFKLAPFGKELLPAAKREDPFAEFEAHG